jgi:hypothetical protein
MFKTNATVGECQMSQFNKNLADAVCSVTKQNDNTFKQDLDVEQRRCTGKVLNLYSGSARFQSRPGHWLTWRGIFSDFPQSLQVNSGIVPRMGHGLNQFMIR